MNRRLINFETDGASVKVRVQSSDAWAFMFGYATNHAAVAEVVARDLQGKLDETIRAIREQAYGDGFKAGQKKRPRRENWFSSFFGVIQ